MLKIQSILSSQLVYCFAIALWFMLLPTALPGQVESVVEPEPVPVEMDEAVEEEPVLESETYDRTYSWENEYKYRKEPLEVRSIDEANWKKAIEGLDFSNKITPKEEEKEVPTSPEPPDFSLFGDGSLSTWLFRGLLLAAAILIIVVVVRNALQMKTTPKDVALPVQSIENIDLQHVEENLDTADLDPLIQRAIMQENYTMAIRLYYLSILKKLSQQQLVFWKKDKTNRDYLRELNHTTLHQPFREVTRNFEWAWYGDVVVGKQDFVQMQGQFQEMLSLIPQNNKP